MALASGIPSPSGGVAIALASIAVHADEAMSSGGHEFDIEAIRGLLSNPDVQAYLDELRPLGLLPEKR